MLWRAKASLNLTDSTGKLRQPNEARHINNDLGRAASSPLL